MATTKQIQYEPGKPIRVFLASPGDVPDERAFVRDHLREVLPNSIKRLGHRDIAFEVVSWDDTHDPLTMPAHLTPQQAVVQYKPFPRDCDIVIVIVASRLGTPLSLDTFQKPDGTAYQSGTEWEYLDAWTADPQPHIFVFRRTDLPDIKVSDPARTAKIQQLDLVDAFFATFTNPDGSARGGYQPYAGLDDFKRKFGTAIETIIPKSEGSSIASLSMTATPVPLPPLCLGRDTDIAAITAGLNPGAAVFVHGPGGIGKTTITKTSAHHADVKARFREPPWFVELETATDLATFDAQLLIGLNLDPSQGFAAAYHRLMPGPALLVLDNLETPWVASQTAVEKRLGQLARIPNLTLLVSFRGNEDVASINWTLRRSVTSLSPPDAKALFLRIAGDDKICDPDLDDFLDALGGVPLAISLVARLAMRHLTLAELWREWQRIGPEVVTPPTGDPHRLTSVSHSIALSLASPLVTVAARRLFAILGQCPAGLVSQDRNELLGSEALLATDALLRTELAYWRSDDRLDLLPPVRDYAFHTKPLQGDGSIEWCRHFLMRTSSVGPVKVLDDEKDPWVTLKPDIANIVAAFLSAPDHGLIRLARSALPGFYRLLLRCDIGSIIPLKKLAKYSQGSANPAFPAVFYSVFAQASYVRRDYDMAIENHLEAASLYRRANLLRLEADSIKRVGDVLYRRADYKGAQLRYEGARNLYSRGDFPSNPNEIKIGKAGCLLGLGRVVARLGDTDRAHPQVTEALNLYREAGSPKHIAVAHTDLAALTTGAERAAHVAAAKAAWREVGLEDQAARVERRFG